MNDTRINRRPLCQHAWGLSLAATAIALSAVMVGCNDSDNRVPTKTEVQAADVNRQAFIDKMNIPESQKAAMKAHMGGPPVASPADAAKANAPQGRRTQ